MVAQFHELLVQFFGQVGQVIGRSGKEDRRHFARAAAHGQNRSGEDPARGLGQKNVADHLPAGGAQGVGHLPVGPGDDPQGFLGGDDDGGERQKRQREGGPEDRGLAEIKFLVEKEIVEAPADELDEKPQAEEAENDGRHAGQVLNGHAHQGHPAGMGGGVFLQVNGGGDPQGHHRDRHEDDQEGRAEDRRKNAAFGHAGRGGRGQKGPGDVADPVPEDVAQDQRHQQDDAKAGDSRENREGVAREVDPAPLHLPTSRFCSRFTHTWPARLMRKVKTKSRTPMKKSTW